MATNVLSGLRVRCRLCRMAINVLSGLRVRCRLRRMATNVLSGLRGGVVCAGWRLTSYPALYP
ncbi:hypothetical protein, partial [Salmonella enterica]|uniref:hypothetical protein n=1 Tax=Salmonella enterica TaxID=28901 RepID=UPI001CB7D7DB